MMQPDPQCEISVAEVAELLESENKAPLVDVRTPEEWQIANIEGSQLLTDELHEKMLGTWDKAALIVFC